MKKACIALAASLLLCSLPISTATQAAPKISIYIDGVKLPTDQAPIAVQGRTMLPFRAIFEALDAKVYWNQKTKTVTGVSDGNVVTLKIGSKQGTINGEVVKLDVSARALNGRTLVPVRFVSESLGREVGWDPAKQRVTINSDQDPDVEEGVTAVTYVNVRKAASYGDGRDIEVSFPRAANEAGIAQYRVYLVKSSKSSSFNLTAALSARNENYSVLYPKGNDQVLNMTSGSRDTDGETIRANQAYNAYVVSVGKVSGQNAMSGASQAITPSTGTAVPVATNVKVTDIADYGDGRDVSVSFSRASNESNINSYRVMVVKTKDASKFDVSAANAVSSSYYTTVSKSGSSTLSTVLSSSARDTSGELIKNGVPYTVYVLSVSNSSSADNRLSSGSSSITLNYGTIVAPVITSVNDISNYGDGRDLRVSFNKISDESKIGSYRIMVVKSNNAGSFDLSRANAVSSYNYTSVNKTGYNLTQALSSSARDVDGDYIRNGIAYRVFVLAVGAGSYSGTNVLSAPSSTITLYSNGNVTAVTGVTASDVSDYGDGRDLRVTFNRASDESNIDSYRIMVVKSAYAGSFDLYDANNVSSYNYTTVSKSGYTLSQILASGARDVNGDVIKNGVSYRVFVLSVASNGYSSNALSSPSAAITLSDQYNVSAATNVKVYDMNDYGDGRDLRVTFNRASNESSIGSYRVFFVKSSKAGGFNEAFASSLPATSYTVLTKTGANIDRTFSTDTRDADGEKIKADVSYRAYVLSVGTGAYANSYALSSPSADITLNIKRPVDPATNVVAADIADNGNGSDLQVSFERANEEGTIKEYRILVVKSDKARDFDLQKANIAKYAKVLSKTGNNITVQLDSKAVDTDGESIKNGVAYQVFVLSVGSESNGNELSTSSQVVTLKGKSVAADMVKNVTVTAEDGKGSANVSFGFQLNKNYLSGFKVFVVRSNATLDLATSATAKGKALSKDDTTALLGLQDIDITGAQLLKDTQYKVYILSIADGTNATINALSEPSNEFSITVAQDSTLIKTPNPVTNPEQGKATV